MKKIYPILAAAICAIAASCAKAPVLEVTDTDFSDVPQAGSVYATTITTNNPWTAQCSESWIFLSSRSGEEGSTVVNIDISANNEVNDRTATIDIISSSLKKTITVKQSQKDKVMLKEASGTISKDAQTFDVKLNSNVEYTVSIPSDIDWIERTTKSKAYKEYTETFRAALNEDFDDRTAKITFKSKDGKLTEVYTLTQQPTMGIILKSEADTVRSTGATLTIEVKTNIDVVCTIPEDITWVKTSTKGLSSKYYTFTVAYNADLQPRTAKIRFSGKSNPEIFVEHTIYQEPRVNGELLIIHHSNVFKMPYLMGEGVSAVIDWGDNSLPVPYEHGITHTYFMDKSHQILTEVENVETVSVESVLGLDSINLSAL